MSGTSASGRPATALTALEEFAAVIGHELRTPLAVVLTAAETVTTQDLPPEQLRAMLDTIRRNANLAVLLTDRLGLARDIEAGNVHLVTSDLDLVSTTTETIHDLGPTSLGRHPVRITAEPELWLEADETAISEILFNLLLNAAKYSPPETVIDVTVSSEDGSAVLMVRDHGDGVSPEDRLRIFDKYFQVDRGSAGVGLGLYISRGLARAHGGELMVRPATPQGSEFVMRLPLRGSQVKDAG